MRIEQHLAVGGPLDGRVVQMAGTGIELLEQPDWRGHYRRTRMSENVRVFMWFPKVDKWTKRRKNVTWGVPKRPFGR